MFFDDIINFSHDRKLGARPYNVRPLLFLEFYSRMNTIVYIDGFNLYYGAVKGTPYKWLDLQALCQMLLPQHNTVI